MTVNLAHRSRLRVLHVARDAGYGGLGGAEILVVEFVRRLSPDRFDRYLCTTRMPEPERLALSIEEADELEQVGVHVLNLGRRSSASILPWRRLWQLLVRERIDIVHAHMLRANVPAALLARLAGVPVVISHEHGSSLYEHSVRRALNLHIVGRLSDVVLSVSESDRANLIEGGMPADRVRVLPNGILPLPSGADVRAELAPDGRPLVGAVGRLYPVKGYDDLIGAVRVLKERGTAVRCVIAGVGPDETRLRGLIDEQDLQDDVRLLGLRDDVPSLLRAFDVAVMSSHSEGSPLAILEYMAAGLPIVSTRVGGVSELISDGEHGLLVAPQDPAALADGLGRILSDSDLGARLGAAAQARQLAGHDLDRTIGRLEGLYVALYERAEREGRTRGRRRGRRLVGPVRRRSGRGTAPSPRPAASRTRIR
jgi:glycosyltransferase involved in cell wall biosynthesis